MLGIDLLEAMLVRVSRVPANRPLWSIWSKVFADPQRGDAISDEHLSCNFHELIPTSPLLAGS